MTLRISGEIHEVVEGETVLASARLYRPYDDLLRLHGIIPNPPMPLVLSDLEGSGNGEAMTILVRHFQEIARTTPIHASVMDDNPKREKLIRRYTAFGMKQTMVMMVMDLREPT